MTKTAAVEFAPEGIRVNVVFPGFYETEMMLNASPEMRARLIGSVPMGRIGEPEELSSIVVFLASDESRYTTGAEIAADGGLTSK
jgi:NAD(P)-dependent dehydrogenase (short-subunit alcohol dehydrogenase family)